MKKIVYFSLVVITIALIVLQFIQSKLPQNAPVQLQDKAQVQNAGDEVMAILKTSCFDCHSNQTNYRWYSYIAPVSWQIAKDVEKGRKALNFSEWDTYTKRKLVGKLTEIKEQVSKGEMPMKIYCLIHPGTRLDDAKKLVIATWVDQENKKIMGQ